jgi:2'-5' RNA ligase
MGFAVEMYFDRTTEDALRGLRLILAQSGVRPVLDELGDRPHISLGVFSQLDVNSFERCLREFARDRSPLFVRLEGVGSFPGVVFLRPEKTAALLRIHSEFHAPLGKQDVRSTEYYLPGNWVPHCTMAQDVEEALMEKAIQTIGRNFQPMTGEILEMGLVEFRPVVSLYRFPLGGQGG